jgi:hypothetical protein
VCDDRSVRPHLVLALAACGRIHFDALGDATTNGHSDGASSAPDASACTPFDSTFPNMFTGTEMAFAWTGSSYVLFVQDSPYELYAFDVGGNTISSTPMPDVINIGEHALAWTGSELVAAWGGTSGLTMQRFDASLQPTSTEITVAPGSVNTPAVAWTGSALAFAWIATGNNVSVQQTDIDGNVLATGSIHTPPIVIAYSVVPTANGFLLPMADTSTPEPFGYVGWLDPTLATATATELDFGRLSTAASLVAAADGSFVALAGQNSTQQDGLETGTASGVPANNVVAVPEIGSSFDAGEIVVAPPEFRIIGSSFTALWDIPFTTAGGFGVVTQRGSFTPSGGVQLVTVGASDRVAVALAYTGAATKTIELIQFCL